MTGLKDRERFFYRGDNIPLFKKQVNRRSGMAIGVSLFFSSLASATSCGEKPTSELSTSRPWFTQEHKSSLAVTSDGAVYDRRFVEDDHAANLKQAIERQYNVEIFTRGERYERKERIRGREARLVDGHPDLAAKWDVSGLEMLREYLALLPQHFYLPKDDGRKVHIILSHFSDSSSCYPFGFAGEGDPCEVELNHESTFIQDRRKHAFSRLAHELIHVATPARLKDSLAGPFERVYLSPWFDRIDDIFGEEFDLRRRTLYQAIQEKRDPMPSEVVDVRRRFELDQHLTEEEERELFFRRFEYALGYYPGGRGRSEREREKASEFIAVLGEHYLHGREYFFRMYGDFFPEEIIEELYNFVKDDIFKSKEYPVFPIG